MNAQESASDWLIRVGPLAKLLNAESAGDCPSGTVAFALRVEPIFVVSPASAASIDYRKEGEQ